MKLEDRTEEQGEVTAERIERLEQELAEAERERHRIAAIHQSLLPEAPPKITGVQIAMSHVAPHEAGGDYYDFIPRQRGNQLEPDPDGRWLIVIADASGHGPAAAMIMAMLQAVLHAYTGEDQEPGSILAFVNEQMSETLIEGAFVTALFAILDPAKRQLSYSTAGHHPPLLKGLDGQVETMDISLGGPPLGVQAESEFGTHHYRFQPGESILFFTDGAIEPRSPEGEEFTTRRLCETLQQADESPRKVLAQINRAIRKHRNGEAQDDDKTLVLLKFTGEDVS